MRARTGTWNTRLRQSWSERRSYRSRVEQLWLRLWRHRPARGPQGERREKANRVVGPRMERKCKNSASWRGSRAVGVQRVRTREPLQEAAPDGRPGRLGDAVEAGAPVGSREASCFPGKLLFLMRPRGTGRRWPSRTRCRSSGDAAATRRGRRPARNGPRQGSGWGPPRTRSDRCWRDRETEPE